MINKSLDFARQFLNSSKYLPVLLAITFVLHIAGIVAALGSDDYLQWAALSGSESLFEQGFVAANPDNSLPQQLDNQFNFFDPKEGNLAQLIDYGALPWWTEEDIKIHLYRPITSLTHWIDYNFWPDSVMWMHFENLMIFMLLVLVVYRLYQDTSRSAGIAALAALIYSMDVSHIESIAWVASRNAFLGPLFGVLAIHRFIKWRETNRQAEMYLSLVFLLCALLSAEAGIAATGYLFAYMLWIDKAPLLKRVVALLPAASLVVVWRLIYNYAGFGSENVAHYVDPGRDLLVFAERLIERFPLMIASVNTGFDGGLRMLSLAQQQTFWVFSVVVTILTCAIFYPILRRDKYARFWMTGAMIAVIPLCTINVTSARVFEFIAIGFFAVLASYTQWAFSNVSAQWRGKWQTGLVRLLAGFGLLAHIGLASLALTAGSVFALVGHVKGEVKEVIYPFYDFEEMDYKDRYLVVANAPHVFLLQFVPYKLSYRDMPIPAGIRALAPGLSTLHITRLGERELLVDVEGGFSIYSHIDVPGEVAQSTTGVAHNSRMLMGFFGRSDRTYTLGQQFSYDDTVIEIAELLDGRPKAIKVRFNYPVDQEKYLFVQWHWDSLSYTELELPAIGEQVLLKGPFYEAEALLK